jgi:hypothetical protein
MQYPSSYVELASSEINLSPPSLEVFRGHTPIRPLQYFDDTGQEFIAVEDLQPYGDRTQEALFSNEAQPFSDLLPIDHVGEDYTVFRKPVDLLPVVALTLGSRSSDGSLDNLYAHVGRQVALDARKFTMRDLGIKNLALLRESGQLVFIPPFHFKYGLARLGRLRHNLTSSIESSLQPVVPDARIRELTRLAIEGLENINS